MDYADVLERDRLASEDAADALDDAIEAECERVAAEMRQQVADARRLRDLTRPILMSSDMFDEVTVDIDWATGEWWSEHYTDFLFNPGDVWEAFLSFWIGEHAMEIARKRVNK